MSHIAATALGNLAQRFEETLRRIEAVNVRHELDWEGVHNINFRSLETYLRLSPQYKWDIARAVQAVKNFKNFFALFAIADFTPMPTPDIATVWASCVLHTELYASLCEETYGRFMHHEPFDELYIHRGGEAERLQRTKALYEEMTGRTYDDHFEYWPCDRSPYDGGGPV